MATCFHNLWYFECTEMEPLDWIRDNLIGKDLDGNLKIDFKKIQPDNRDDVYGTMIRFVPWMIGGGSLTIYFESRRKVPVEFKKFLENEMNKRKILRKDSDDDRFVTFDACWCMEDDMKGYEDYQDD